MSPLRPLSLFLPSVVESMNKLWFGVWHVIPLIQWDKYHGALVLYQLRNSFDFFPQLLFRLKNIFFSSFYSFGAHDHFTFSSINKNENLKINAYTTHICSADYYFLLLWLLLLWWWLCANVECCVLRCRSCCIHFWQPLKYSIVCSTSYVRVWMK